MDPALQTITELSVFAFFMVSLPALTLTGRGLFGSGRPEKKKRYRMIGGAIFFVLLMIIPSGAFAETVNTHTTEVDMNAEHALEANHLFNTADLHKNETDIDTWAFQPEGMYVGPGLRESEFKFKDIVTGGEGVFHHTAVAVQWKVTFSSLTIGSGISRFWFRSPIDNTGFQSGELEVYRIKSNGDYVRVGGITSFTTNDTILVDDGNAVYNSGNRTYLYVRAPIFPSVQYLFKIQMTTNKETFLKMYFTQYDVASDGENETNIIATSYFPEKELFTYNIPLDPGVSFFMVEGMTSDGVFSNVFALDSKNSIYFDSEFEGFNSSTSNDFTFILPFRSSSKTVNATIYLYDNFLTEITSYTDTFTNFFFISTPVSVSVSTIEIKTTDLAYTVMLPLVAGKGCVGEKDADMSVSYGFAVWYWSMYALPFASGGYYNYTLEKKYIPAAYIIRENVDWGQVVGGLAWDGLTVSLIFVFPPAAAGVAAFQGTVATVDYMFGTNIGSMLKMTDAGVYALVYDEWTAVKGESNKGFMRDALDRVWDTLLGFGTWVWAGLMKFKDALVWTIQQIISFSEYLLAFLALFVVPFIYYFSVLATITIMGLFLKLFKGKYEEASDIAASKLKTNISMLRGVR